ncbi:MAG: HAD family hydrolase [Candidatus Riflebacteria bacterium]|nr:HAD family hydrolase [Candidatus Riflebacteria bacterium]
MLTALRDLKVIGFDADDTLWSNEPFFVETEKKFCALLKNHFIEKELKEVLYKMELENLELYGYGVKGFMLSMIETAVKVSKTEIPKELIAGIINLGKEMLEKPIELLNGIENVLNTLNGKYRLIIATRGDLLDQERKLRKSGISRYFHHIEIMSDKKEKNYLALLERLNIEPKHFLMIGNSFKSDILPVLNIGGLAAYVPFHVIWEHDRVANESSESNERLLRIKEISEILNYIDPN